jgi:hypothetical protein
VTVKAEGKVLYLKEGSPVSQSRCDGKGGGEKKVLYLKEGPPVSQSRCDGEGGGEGEYLRPADRVRGGTPALSTAFRDSKQTFQGSAKIF